MRGYGMGGPANSRLYAAVKREANSRFLAPTSAYKSAWIVREYKKRGGTYVGGRKTREGLKRWFREKWVDVATRKPCGRRSSGTKGPYPLCRPSVRVTKKTPATMRELSAATLRRARARKQKVKHRGKVKFD